MIKKLKAFTLVEVMISLVILTFVGMLGFLSFAKITPKTDKLKFKNANLSLKHSISSLLNNPMYYDEEAGFMDLEEVTFEDKYTHSRVGYEGLEKFRNLLLKELGISTGNSNLNCFMISDSFTPYEANICYISESSVVWAIPNTDFYTKGVVPNPNSSGGTSSYVPITIYGNAKRMNTADDFERNAIVLGVRADGAIKLLDTKIDCKDKKYKSYAQCDVADVFASLDTRFEQE